MKSKVAGRPKCLGLSVTFFNVPVRSPATPSFESELIQLTNLTFVDPAQWLGNGGNFEVEVTNGTFNNLLFIDADTELSSMPIPQQPFHAIGLGGQHADAPPKE